MKATIQTFQSRQGDCIFFTIENGEKRIVTMIDCGSARYSPREISPLFKGCIYLENVALPSEFWKVLGLKMDV